MNSFGAGYLVGRAAATTANPNPTPRKFGQLQEVSVDDSFDVKKLMGARSLPIREFRGQRKFDIKAKFAYINGAQFSELFHAGTVTTGAVLTSMDEQHTVPATPFQVTITPPNSGTFTEDFGVVYSATGIPLTFVASGPTQGQYSLSGAVYTFAAADAAAAVAISYSYATTTGLTVSVPNLVQQESPYFEVFLSNPQDGGLNRKFFKCSASKLNEQFKQGDIMIPELDISVFDPGTGIPCVDYYAAL